MKIFSSTTLISLGLACLTLSLILMAHSIGISPDDAQELIRSRMQSAELVAAQCSPAAKKGDVQTMADIVRQIASQNEDLLSAGLRTADGRLVYTYGPHPATWGAGAAAGRGGTGLSVPIANGVGDWGSLELCYKSQISTHLSFLPNWINQFFSNPTMRLALF